MVGAWFKRPYARARIIDVDLRDNDDTVPFAVVFGDEGTDRLSPEEALRQGTRGVGRVSGRLERGVVIIPGGGGGLDSA